MALLRLWAGRAEDLVGRAVEGRRDEQCLSPNAVWSAGGWRGRKTVRRQDGKMIHRYLGTRSVRGE